MSTQPSKLDVTSEQLRSLYTQFQTILDEKVALHLPQEQDSVKGEVLLQLQKYLVEAMEAASGSLRVVNVKESASMADILARSQEQFVEPFDLALNEQVRQKYQEWEDQTVKVAQLRREAPRKLCESYKSEAQEVLKIADRLIEGLPNDSDLGESIEEEGPALTTVPEFREDYMEALTNLAEVKEQLPRNRANLQKLGQLVNFLEGELDSG
ncbi:LADA_0F12640g1_1 [Lachancea dasiensis]|uniref:LADA_0F12640g1_1 n=1 Tax=Lachancea dasiensis TaxID=1072105 RepID=A0A1G4JN41_9SACH|nr:LADA_0F12640g1_1 [Lachancea dasiensis]